MTIIEEVPTTGRQPALDGVEYGLVDDDEVEEVPFNCSARAWNAAKFLGPDSTALAEKTIPCPQWFACLQKAQIGFVSLTWTV